MRALRSFKLAIENLQETVLRDLSPSRLYYAQVRAINTHGRSSQLSLPPIAIRTRAENGTEFLGDPSESIFSSSFVITLVSVMAMLVSKRCGSFRVCKTIAVLAASDCKPKQSANRRSLQLLINCLVFGFYYSQHRRRLRVEKTEFVRRANYGNERRPLQLYGAIGGVNGATPPMGGANSLIVGGGGSLGGHSPVTFSRRPGSNSTNKSDLLHEEMSEDDQSVRTMIVSVFFCCCFCLCQVRSFSMPCHF